MKRHQFISVSFLLMAILLTLGITPSAMTQNYQPPERFSPETPSAGAATQSALNTPVEPIPHPVLDDVNVRRAVAYCTDKDALIATAYPSLTPAQRQELVMDTFVPTTHWAYSAPATTYSFNPSAGMALLDAAGWTIPPTGDIRVKDGKQLVFTLTADDSEFRKAFLTVFEAQMRICGIDIVRNHQPGSWWYSDDTGLSVRDFEAGEYAWVGGGEPGGYSCYGCDQIPLPTNGWSGQNFMGWCNQAASDAIQQASDTGLPQAQRQMLYATFIDLFAEDMPSLPLFMRDGGTAASYAWEHIDFNLQTFTQDVEVTPSAEAVLSYTDFSGNQGTIVAPVGAVTQTVTLGYVPLVANANPPPANLETAIAFRLNASLSGVSQDHFSFSEPITVTVGYNAEDIVDVFDENSLALYYWDGDAWQDASTTCLEADRHERLDATQNLFEVTICHLSEFALIGAKNHRTYLPFVIR